MCLKAFLMKHAYKMMVPTFQKLLSDAMATMLFVGSSLQLCYVLPLAYLFHHHDRDFRMFARSVLSSIVSMFFAILVMSALGIFEYKYILVHLPGRTHFVVFVVQMLLFHTLMQVPMADRRAKWYAVLVSNMFAIASIHVWCILQQRHLVGVVTLAAGVHIFSALICHAVRSHFCGDGVKVDNSSKPWNAAVSDAENDSMSFVLSFLMVQSFRYWACREIPNAYGVESWHAARYFYFREVTLLITIGCSAVLVGIALRFNPPEILSEFDRLRRALQETCYKLSAWCLTYVVQAIVSQIFIDWQLKDHLFIDVLAAAIVSVACGLTTLIIDKIADCNCTKKSIDKILRQFMRVFQKCIAITWIQCFRTALAVLPGKSMPWMPYAILVCAFLVVLPAWTFILLPMVMESAAETTGTYSYISASSFVEYARPNGGLAANGVASLHTNLIEDNSYTI